MKTESAPDLIRQFFLEEHPNPERIGCPSEETVRAAAEDRLPATDPARLHFADCSECFAEYRGYRLDWERKRAGRRRIVAWSIAAGVLLAVGGAITLRHHLGPKQAPQQMAHNLPPSAPQPPAPDSKTSSPPPVQTKQPDLQQPIPPRGKSDEAGKAVRASLDLAPEIRDQDPTQQQRKRLLRLRAAELNLSVLLPPSSGTGKYQLQITQDVEGQKVLASSFGRAVNRDGRVRLRLHLPLTAVAPGDYFLSVIPQANAGQNNSGQINSGQNNAGQNNHQQSQAVYDVQVVPR